MSKSLIGKWRIRAFDREVRALARKQQQGQLPIAVIPDIQYDPAELGQSLFEEQFEEGAATGAISGASVREIPPEVEPTEEMKVVCDADRRRWSPAAAALAATFDAEVPEPVLRAVERVSTYPDLQLHDPPEYRPYGVNDFGPWSAPVLSFEPEVLLANYRRALRLLRHADALILEQRARLLDLFRVEEPEVTEKVTTAKRRRRTVKAVPDESGAA
jgi:hypothetical protein